MVATCIFKKYSKTLQMISSTYLRLDGMSNNIIWFPSRGYNVLQLQFYERKKQRDEKSNASIWVISMTLFVDLKDETAHLFQDKKK